MDDLAALFASTEMTGALRINGRQSPKSHREFPFYVVDVIICANPVQEDLNLNKKNYTNLLWEILRPIHQLHEELVLANPLLRD